MEHTEVLRNESFNRLKAVLRRGMSPAWQRQHPRSPVPTLLHDIRRTMGGERATATVQRGYDKLLEVLPAIIDAELRESPEPGYLIEDVEWLTSIRTSRQVGAVLNLLMAAASAVEAERMPEEISQQGRALALALWQEQIEFEIGQPGEIASEDRLSEWLANRVYNVDVLEAAAAGDVAALVQVRTEAGLPILS